VEPRREKTAQNELRCAIDLESNDKQVTVVVVVVGGVKSFGGLEACAFVTIARVYVTKFM
jgi:hypothetical protein